MTEEAIRVAVAEGCEWVLHKNGYCWTGPGGALALFPEYLPNYPRDLNAMHEAEKVLEQMDNTAELDSNYPHARTKYIGHLIELTGKSVPYHATARQRAEAFLRTIGKWTE